MGAVAPARAPERPARRAALGPGRVRPAKTLRSDDVLDLQREAGNQAVQRLVGGGGPTLRTGSSGQAVAQLQQALIGAGAHIKSDGSFGPATHAAVVAFQKGAGLAADGVVGPKTWKALQGGGGGGQGQASPDKVALLKSKLALLQAKVAELGGKPGAPKEASSTPMVEPEMRGGWFDDAADWVEDKASDAASAVGDAASSAASWVEEKASDAASAVGDAASGAASWVEEKVGDAGAWVSETASDVGGFATGVAEGLGQQLGDLGEDLSGVVGPIVGPILADIGNLGGGVGLSPTTVDNLLAKVEKALAGLGNVKSGDDIFSDLGIDLGGGTPTGKTDYSAPAAVAAKYTFTDGDFNSLMATLTTRQANGEEIGSCQPTITYTLNGANEGNGLPDDEKVTSAIFKVVDNISLPDWTNVGKAQPSQQSAWNDFAGGVAAHENLHAADDKKFLGSLHVGCLGKTVKQAVDFVNAQITASNDQSPKRDASDPPPRLRQAGTTRVP